MDYKIMSAVYSRDVQLTQYEYCVLMTLACAAKDDKSLPSPSLKRIADRSGMSVRQVSRTVATLSERGLLSVSKRQTASGQWCNLYHVHTDKFGTQKPIDESEYKSGSESNMDSQSNMDGSTKSGEGVQRVAKSGSESNYNNIVNNIDNNKENNNKTDKTVDSGVKGGLGGNQHTTQKVTPPKGEPPKGEEPTTPTTEAPTSQASRSVCLSDVKPREIAKMALAKLVAEGMPDQEGKERINGTWKTYLAELDTLKGRGWKKKNGEAITSANYLVGMLATMAKEYKPSEPQAEEPTRLEDIFNLLKKEWAEQYPEVADRFKTFELIDLHPSTENKLRAKESADWKNVNSRLAYVRNALEGTVFERVQGWRQDEIKDISSCLYHVRKALAQYRFEPKSYYNPRKTVEEEIAELEEREKRCHAELQRLRKLTTRPTAA